MPATTGVPNRLVSFIKSYRTEKGLRALRNLIGLVFWTGLSQLCAFGMLLLLTSLFDSTRFGAIVFGLSVQSYLFTISTAGLYLPLVRDLTQNPAQADQTISAFFGTVISMSLIVGMVTILLALTLPITMDERILLCLIATGNIFASLNLSPVYDAHHQQALVGMLSVPGDLLAFLIVLWLGLSGQLSVPLVGVALASKWMLTLFLHCFVLRRWIRPFRWQFERKRMRELAQSGWPIMLASVCYLAPLHGSVLLVRMLHGEHDAAIYGLAFQVAQVYLMMSWLVSRVLQPHISGPYGLDRLFVIKLIAICVSIYGGTWICAVAGGWLLTHRILNEEYQASFFYLVLLLLGTVAYAIAMILNSYLTRLKIERVIMKAYVLGVITFAVFSFAAWQYFQLTTFALAIVVSSQVIIGFMGWQIVAHLQTARSACRSPAVGDI